VKELSRRFDPTSVLIVVLMLIVVVAVMFGIDLINGRWDEPLIQPPL
jgi:preprotein translocase subunit SecE